ncbi:MAG TPA: DUF1674 domain-containing protein [Rhodanobacteraceae bacterium]|nr:DUF1674 domain-containing protein [Rhodanobacteraceae bacterium]
MSSNEPDTKRKPAEDADPAPSADERPAPSSGQTERPDPTRYGDWEKNGRCIDF